MKTLKIFILSLLFLSVMVTCDAKNDSEMNKPNFPTSFKEYVKPPAFDAKFYKSGNTGDILNGIRIMDRKDVSNLSTLVDQFRDGKEGLKDFHDFIIYHVQYVADPIGEQLIKTPQRMLYSGEGDCKSYSVAIAAFAKLKGYQYEYEATSYQLFNSLKTHIYTTVIIDGERIPTDPVLTTSPVTDSKGVADHEASKRLMFSRSGNKFGKRKFYYYRTILKGESLSGFNHNIIGDIAKTGLVVGTGIIVGNQIYKAVKKA